MIDIDPSKLVETRRITTPKGGVLEIDMTDEFLVKMRQHFTLGEKESPSDDQLRMFVFGTVKTAIDKAEASGGIKQS
jgi:hypothetical protein